MKISVLRPVGQQSFPIFFSFGFSTFFFLFFFFFYFYFQRQFFSPPGLPHRTIRNSVIGNKFTGYFAGISSVKSALRQSISRVEITFRSPRVFPIETRVYTTSPLIAFLFCSDQVDNALNATLCQCRTKGRTINGKIESHYVLLSCVAMLQRVKLEHENGWKCYANLGCAKSLFSTFWSLRSADSPTLFFFLLFFFFFFFFFFWITKIDIAFCSIFPTLNPGQKLG